MIDSSKYHCWKLRCGGDAALIGCPAAGKSTLFNALTGRSDSKKMPRYEKIQGLSKEIVLADIGGISRANIIPYELWLSCIETCKVLIFVLPLKLWQRSFSQNQKNLPPESQLKRALKDFNFLLKKINLYKKGLFADKKRVVIYNQFQYGVSGIETPLFSADLKGFFPAETAFLINAAAGEGIDDLKNYLEPFGKGKNGLLP